MISDSALFLCLAFFNNQSDSNSGILFGIYSNMLSFFFLFFLVTESNLRVFFFMCFCGAAYDFSIGLGVLCVGQGLFSALGGKER